MQNLVLSSTVAHGSREDAPSAGFTGNAAQSSVSDEYSRAFFAIMEELHAFSRNMRLGNDVNATERNAAVMAMGALDSLLGKKLMDKAIAVANRKGAVVEFRSKQSDRRCFRVKGDEGTYRGLFSFIIHAICCCCVLKSPDPLLNSALTVQPGYCTCRNFPERLAAVTTIPLCKHLIALALCEAEGTLEVKIVNEEEWAAYALQEAVQL